MEENKKKNNRKRHHYLIMGLLLIIVLVSGAMVLHDYMEGRRAEEEYRRLAELAKQTTEAPTTAAPTTEEKETETEPETEPPYVSPIDFEELLALNPDTIGWIRIPDTNIDYPIVQNDNNDTYLHTDFYGDESIYGTIYLDFESDADLMGKNNILYGHNMRNGSMFKDLVYYKEEQYFKDHQFFEIYTPERTIRLKAISCYYDKAQPIFRKTKFKTEGSYKAFINEMLSPCAYAEIPEEPINALYTLVTCSYEVDDARTFVFAVEVDEEGNVVAAEDGTGK